ncbi:PREDICTED: uncharacterized protein LOC108363971, partial [Rhagoletis zephyria]|uniref:uncharacterized protein LOC108363971 n=1 Tax=Rhagoletis zephyria TaxID=28612 RepID=UPI0008114504
MPPSKKPDDGELKRKKCESLAQQMLSINTLLTPEYVLSLDEAAVEVRLDQVNRLEGRFDIAQPHVEDDDDVEEILARFTTHYMEAKIKLTRQLHTSRNVEAHHSTTRPTADGPPSFVFAPPKQRLPTLQIPKFSGSYADWPDFFSMFKTVVHQDADLTRIEKFQHLRSSLRDAALDTIRSLEICDQNYDKALELLKNRFDNKRLNFQTHVRTIFQLDNIVAGSVASLRGLSDKLNAHLRVLATLGTKNQIADG